MKEKKKYREIMVRVDAGLWVEWLTSKGMSREDVAREVARACGVKGVRRVCLIIGGKEKVYDVHPNMEVREIC